MTPVASLPPRSGQVATLLSDAAARWPDDAALAIPGDRSFSFRELNDLAARFAGALARAGIGHGDRVVLHLANGWQWVVAYHAIARLGAVIVPANILLTSGEVCYMATDSGARALIDPGDPKLAEVPVTLRITIHLTAHALQFDELLSAAPCEPAAMAPGDLLSIGYTSGTTGTPKGVMLTHGNIAESIGQTATCHVRHRGDRVYSALPFTHVYGNIVLNACLMTGALLVAPARFDPGATLDAIGALGITRFEGVPTMYYQMLSHAALDRATLTSLGCCTVGGQTIPVAKIDQIVARFGCPVLELWGMTELAGPAVSHSPYWPPRHGSIGLPFPGTQVRIVDLDDPTREVPDDVAGELMVRGPLVTAGYWNRPEATAERIDGDGWLSTGDVARCDADGYLYVVDRKTDMILTAGYNVYPAEVEQAVALHPAVSMVAVSGHPDEEKGEIAHAFVVLRAGHTATSADLIAHCRRHLAAYKIPRVVHLVDELPCTSTGKILRRALQPGPSPR